MNAEDGLEAVVIKRRAAIKRICEIIVSNRSDNVKYGILTDIIHEFPDVFAGKPDPRRAL